MIVSTKGRYALRVMIDLSEHQSEKYVPLKEIAARQEISEKYLENILKVLVQNGFLEGLRGKGGGYRLTRSPDQYRAVPGAAQNDTRVKCPWFFQLSPFFPHRRGFYPPGAVRFLFYHNFFACATN